MKEENTGSAMRRYFQGSDEFTKGKTITTYVEFTDEVATRQVDIIGDRWYCSAFGDYHAGVGMALTDQKLSAILPLAQHESEITAEQFESVWNEALRRHQRS